MARPMKKKLVYSADTPFSAAEWPEISSEDQDTILELLCSLLTPIGQHRQRHIQPSGGKRSAKRKRAGESAAPRAPEHHERPPMPELTSFVDVGLTSITRNLEKLAACTSSDQLSTSASLSPYTVIFVARSGQSSAFNSQLPQMVAVASSSSSEPPTRLVGYSKPCAERLSAALGIPRVSSVGIRVGAPVSKALVDFVQQHVAPVKIAWMEEAHDATYRQTKLRVEEKVITVKKSRQVMNKDEQE